MARTKRRGAIHRAFALLYSVVALTAGVVAVPVGLVWGVVDILWQLVTGREGLKKMGNIQGIVVNTLWWSPKLLAYAATGRGRLYWLPQFDGNWGGKKAMTDGGMNMPGTNQARRNAVLRLIYGIIWVPYSILTAVVVLPVSLVIMVLDVIWQFVVGSPGISNDNVASDTFLWWFSNWAWVLFNRSGFRWIPPIPVPGM